MAHQSAPAQQKSAPPKPTIPPPPAPRLTYTTKVCKDWTRDEVIDFLDNETSVPEGVFGKVKSGAHLIAVLSDPCSAMKLLGITNDELRTVLAA